MTYRKRIGYAKLGRSLKLERTTFGFQGDAEAPNLLIRLARRNPDVEFVITGRNDRIPNEQWTDLPNITNPWTALPPGTNGWRPGREPKSVLPPDPVLVEFERYMIEYAQNLDGAIVHVGQHGSVHLYDIPKSSSTWAQFDAERARGNWTYSGTTTHGVKPQMWALNYGGSLLRGLDAMGDRTDGRAPVAWIVTDPRNYIKARDIKWPTGRDFILAQYDFSRDMRCERFRDPRTPEELGFASYCRAERNGELWISRDRYGYAGLELMILPDDWETWGQAGFEDRKPVGVATTSMDDGRSSNEPRRSELVRDFVLKEFPDAEVFGKWDKVSLADVPHDVVRLNRPEQFPDLLNSWRVTVSLPALGSSWTAAKPFQCFAANVACFLVDRLDEQGWILPSRRRVEGTHEVAPGFYSIRDDWTQEDLTLAQWLRVETVPEFVHRAKIIASDRPTYDAIAAYQRDLLRRRWDQALVERATERRLGLDG